MPRVVIYDTVMHNITTNLQPLCNRNYSYVIAILINIELIKYKLCRISLKDSDTVSKLRETLSPNSIVCFCVCFLFVVVQEQSIKYFAYLP